MTDPLDHLLQELAQRPLDRSLDLVEAEIARDFGARRSKARETRALVPVSLGAVALALATGMGVGSVTAAAAGPLHGDTLTSAGALAPSTLLEGR